VVTNVFTHTIDAGPPTSSVLALPAVTNSASFTVSWAGSDDADGLPGSGVASFDIFVSDNGGPFAIWLDDTADTSAVYTGVEGHTYAFYSRATDNVAHVEPDPVSADAGPITLDLTAISLTDLQLIAAPRRTLAAVALTFSKPLDVPQATNAANYRLTRAGQDKLLGTADDKTIELASASYDATSRTVQLAIASSKRPLKLTQAFQITIHGTSLTDEAGNPWDGDGDGSPGGDYRALAGNKFSYRDHDADRVSLALGKAGTGVMQLVRRADGEGYRLVLPSTLTSQSVLSGKVKAAIPPSDQRTTLQSIIGLDGAVNKLPLCGFGNPSRTSLCFEVPDAVISAAIVDIVLESDEHRFSAR
jgi:hypothetical protein